MDASSAIIHKCNNCPGVHAQVFHAIITKITVLQLINLNSAICLSVILNGTTYTLLAYIVYKIIFLQQNLSAIN